VRAGQYRLVGVRAAVFVYLLLFAGFIFFAAVDIPWDLVLQYGLIALGIVLLLTLLYHGWKRWLSLPRL
jgi:hypothetical protein